MSRSYKKNPYCTDGYPKTTKEKKRCANKKVRNTSDLPQYGGYKKVFDSYDIHDWINYWPWEEAKRRWENSGDDDYIKKHYPTLKSYYRLWLKCYKSK